MAASTQGILDSFERHAEAVEASRSLVSEISRAAISCCESLQKGGTIFWAGNGGSMSDAIHMSAELVGRFTRERGPISSIALGTNASTLSAVSNDYSFEDALARELDGLGKSGDVLIAISTSGNSKNILKLAHKAREKNIHVIALSGQTGGSLKELSDTSILIPNTETARIQECHQLIEHIICDWIEEESTKWTKNLT